MSTVNTTDNSTVLPKTIAMSPATVGFLFVAFTVAIMAAVAASLFAMTAPARQAKPETTVQAAAVAESPLSLNPPSRPVVPGTPAPSIVVEEEMTAAIKGPQKLRPGQMAAYRAGYGWSKNGVNLFTAANDFNNDPTEFNWQVAGRNGNIDISDYVSETGSTLFYAFEEPGLYTVTLIMGKVRNGRAVLRSTSLPVTVASSNIPTPDVPQSPDVPTTPEVPQVPPVPEVPQAPETPATTRPELRAWVGRQATAVPAVAKIKKAALSQAYRDGVEFIKNQPDTEPYDSASLVKWQQGRNRTELSDADIPSWKPFFDTLALQLQTLASKGQLKTKQDFIAAWTAIYLGLEQ